jgi:hypothetical protein
MATSDLLLAQLDERHRARGPRSSLRAQRNTVFGYRHDVIPVRPEDECALLRRGEVAVFSDEFMYREKLQDGGIYVIEYQRPRAGMSEEMRQQLGSRTDVERSIIRACRDQKQPERWWAHPLGRERRSGGMRVFICSDGPYWDFQLTDKLIGKVIGVYRPHIPN